MVRTCSLLFFSRALTKAILFGNEFNSHSCCSALPSDNTPELISCIILSVCFMVLLQEIRPEVYAPPIFAHCKNIRTETGNPTPFNFAQPNASLKIRALNKTFLSFYLLLPLPDWEPFRGTNQWEDSQLQNVHWLQQQTKAEDCSKAVSLCKSCLGKATQASQDALFKWVMPIFHH